jgi:hypothetical protein
LGSRSFKGYIVSTKRFLRFAAKPWVYELSFACPRGLSGASVITLDGAPRVTGVVVGNHSIQMNDFTDREIISTDKERTIVERV